MLEGSRPTRGLSFASGCTFWCAAVVCWHCSTRSSNSRAAMMHVLSLATVESHWIRSFKSFVTYMGGLRNAAASGWWWYLNLPGEDSFAAHVALVAHVQQLAARVCMEPGAPRSGFCGAVASCNPCAAFAVLVPACTLCTCPVLLGTVTPAAPQLAQMPPSEGKAQCSGISLGSISVRWSIALMLTPWHRHWHTFVLLPAVAS
jgi:hypothetical protein